MKILVEILDFFKEIDVTPVGRLTHSLNRSILQNQVRKSQVTLIYIHYSIDYTNSQIINLKDYKQKKQKLCPKRWTINKKNQKTTSKKAFIKKNVHKSGQIQITYS